MIRRGHYVTEEDKFKHYLNTTGNGPHLGHSAPARRAAQHSAA